VVRLLWRGAFEFGEGVVLDGEWLCIYRREIYIYEEKGFSRRSRRKEEGNLLVDVDLRLSFPPFQASPSSLTSPSLQQLLPPRQPS